MLDTSSNYTRESALTEAGRLMNVKPFDKATSNKIERLLQLADSLGETGAALRAMRMHELGKQFNVRDKQTLSVEEYKSAFRNYLSGAYDALTLDKLTLAENRALSVGTDASGGYVVPQDFATVFQNGLKAFDGIFAAAKIVETVHGNVTGWPIGDDTATSATIVAENAISIIDTPDPSFVNVTFGKTPTWRSGHLKASMELSQDAEFDLSSVIAELSAQRMARGIGTQMITNLIAGSTSGATAASAGAIVPDDLLSLIASVDPVYAQRGVFLMNMSCLTSILKVKGSTSGDYLLHVDLDAEGRPTLFGRTTYLCPSLPNIATGQKCVLFGNVSDYFIRRQVRDSLSVRVFRERWADSGQLGYETFWRGDSALAKPTVAPCPVRYLTQP